MPGPGGEQALARGRAPTVRLHLSAMMDTAMMVAAVVKASHPGRAGKGLGGDNRDARDADDN
jgi:hypothetical protein